MNELVLPWELLKTVVIVFKNFKDYISLFTYYVYT